MKTVSQILGKDCSEGKEHHLWSQHHNRMGHRTTGKYKVGIGGIDCPCCTKLPPNKLKKKISRLDRRKNKQNLDKIENN